MAPPQYACSQCGLATFYEDDGKWYCDNGHEQEGGQQVGEDDGDYGRAGKISRQKEVREKQKILKIYRGLRGFQLYLKAWQHVLWRQCHALIHQHGLPAELWTIVRDLWNLRLSKLAQRLDKLHNADPTQSSDQSTGSESGIDSDKGDSAKYFKTSKRAEDNPTLPDTISINYIGILLLRHPTSLATVHKCVRQETVCYIRAIRYVPQEVRDHLAPEYHLALDTTVIPTEHDLQLAVYRNATMYGHSFGMILPPLNWALLLLENIKSLALPLEIFPVIKSLAGMLEYGFKYPQNQSRRRNATIYPEAQLMALTVVATKLIYPFDSDSVKRYPQSSGEPAAIRLNWQAWLSAKKDDQIRSTNDGLPPDRAIEVTDADVLRMSEDQLDLYMDWFQQTYAKDIRVEHVRQQILDMFPLKQMPSSYTDGRASRSQEQDSTRLKATQAELRPSRVIAENDDAVDGASAIRPGQHYSQYHSLNNMPEPAAHFHQEAAELACLSTEALMRAVLRTERLLLLHQHEQRRAELFEVE